MLPGRRTDEGAIFITDVAPSSDATFQGGVAVSPLGVIYATSDAPEKFVNGLGVLNDGQLCVSPPPIVGYLDGYPRSATGALVLQLNQPESPGDVYLGGVRIGPLGGIYAVDLTPPELTAFSPGFDGGFQ